MENDLKDRIAVARGIRKADLVLSGGRVVNVFSGEIYRADVAIHQGRIAGLGEYEGKTVIDISSKLILPGLIDSHVHLESSMLTPAEFAKAALPHGTTAVIADPHEIANVLGKKGIIYILKASQDLPLDFYFMLPSCVPATPLETSGARLTAGDLLPFLKHQRVLGLAEMMNYPGVLSGDTVVLRKLNRFRDTLVDGHAPGLSGKELSAYIGAGMTSDHECTSVAEVREKVRLGMTIFIREGSTAKDMEALLPAVTPANSRFFCLATDDFQPGDLKNGSINQLIKKAVRLGVNPITAVQMATINPARHFGLMRKGAILPGYAADVAVIDGFKNFTVEMVFKQGKLVARGDICVTPCESRHHEQTRGTVKINPVTKQDLLIRTKTGKARVIELIPDQIETKHAILPVSSRNGYISSDTERDILKLIVLERHKSTGNMGFGLVKGFGIRTGAIASTVAHDSHNLIAVGASDDDILVAVSEIRKLQGGLVVVNKRKVLAEIPLPVAGLMSDRPLDYVVENLVKVEEAVKRLGVKIKHPFGILSFLALPVIPELKLTDKGLVDVNRFKIVDLFV
ncbi:MAG TPA: adenine deaminase [Nitrospirota bacterium]|nr:adenine deaminase [Nitrospirota bacterium]